MLIIFDTSTKADYYKDVHKVLAAPSGALVPYDYERRLWTEAAQEMVDRFSSKDKPIPALLMYAQSKSYKKGDDDPAYMLDCENAIFIPTRIAEVVNVGFEERGRKERENINVHLRVKNFLDPDTDEIQSLIESLEKTRSLPFGKTRGHKWVSRCPDTVDQAALLAGADKNWAKVIDSFASTPSQFSGDVFWRVLNVRATNRESRKSVLKLEDRDSNTFGSIDSWDIDFRVDDLNRYRFEIQNYIPSTECREPVPKATISVKEDTSSLLILPDETIDLRRNATEHLKFGVKFIDFFQKEDAKLTIETVVDGHEGDYPPGSLVQLTLRIVKNRWRLFGAIFFAVLSAVGVAASLVQMKDNLGWALLTFAGAILSGYISHWMYTDRIKLFK